MPITNCRVCGSDLGHEPLLQYRNMPKAAQNMPEQQDLANEKGVDLDVFQCSGCGLIQLNSDPVPYYREVIRAARFSQEMKRFRLSQFKTLVQQFHLQGKPFLEVGCGRGEYLELLAESGIDATGIEYSQKAVDFCKHNSLPAVQGFIDSEDYHLSDGPFHGFAIFSWLEHLPEPNVMLKGIRNNLTEDAVGIIEVPNFDMIRREKLFSEFIGDHLFYFTKDTLHFTLTMNGYEVLDIQETWHHYILSATVQNRKNTDLSEFIETERKLVEDIHAFVDSFPPKQVAVWGASHQALALLSLADLGEKIRYVIDSAPFKQGKFTPATHIPIVAPETLNSDPVQAIIVMAASYNDEVAKTIMVKFPHHFEVSKVEKNRFEKDIQ